MIVYVGLTSLIASSSMAALRENHRRQVVVGVLGLLGCVALLAIAAGPAPRRSVADLHRIDASAPSTDSLRHHSPPTSLLSFFLLCFLAALTRRLAAQSSRATMIPRLTRSAPPACLCRACAPACVVMHPPRHGSDLPPRSSLHSNNDHDDSDENDDEGVAAGEILSSVSHS